MIDRLLDLPLWYVNFLFAITCHEAAHAWVAYWGGDRTAYLGGQVTLNPVPHVQREPVGTVIVPIASFFLYNFCMGWASAPYDIRWRLLNPRKAGLMALAGPLANLLIALGAGLILRVGLGLDVFVLDPRAEFLGIVSPCVFLGTLSFFLQITVFLNIVLFAFNLLPFPPLDGYAVLGLFLPMKWDLRLYQWAREPNFQLAGLLLSWWLFPSLFGPLWRFVQQIFFWSYL